MNLWLPQPEIAALPTTGKPWDFLKSTADRPYDLADVSDHTESLHHNTQVLAAALVASRLNSPFYRQKVVDEIRKTMAIVPDPTGVLGTCRRIGTYALAADIADLKGFAPSFDQQFRTWLSTELRRKYTGGGGGGSVIDIHERRPNNWGRHAETSRICVDLYLGDKADLEKAVKTHKAFIGHEGTSGWVWHGHWKSWQADPNNPVGVNRKGAKIQGRDVDGIMPDDMERGGAFQFQFKKTGPGITYSFESAASFAINVALLARNGYPDAPSWGDKALLRVWKALIVTVGTTAGYSDTHFAYDLMRFIYDTDADFVPVPTSPTALFKSMAFTDYTHRDRKLSTPIPPLPPTDPCADLRLLLAERDKAIVEKDKTIGVLKQRIASGIAALNG